MDEATLLEALKQRKPYLYKIEMRVRQVQERTGYGEVSSNIRIIKRVADRISFLQSDEEIIKQRKDNIFD